MAKKINIYWSSYNGPGDARGNYIEYDHFAILVKFNEPFTKTAYQSQVEETEGTPGGGLHIVNGTNDLLSLGIDGKEFFLPDEENTKLEPFEAYKFTFDATQGGQYFFAVWAFLEGEAYGPSYSPPRLDIQDGSGEFVENYQGIVVDSDLDAVDLSDTLNIYGLTVANSEINDTPLQGMGQKPSSSAIEIRNNPSPTFKFKASLASSGSTGDKEITFKGRARVTIRPPSVNNKPSKDIFYEFYDIDVTKGIFNFSDYYNSYAFLGSIPEGQKYFQDTKSSFVITDKLTVDNLPLRHFDVVVEGYNAETEKTSAGNELHDNTINENTEGDFTKDGKDGIPGYDICEVKLLAPEGLIFLQEYSLRDGFVTPQQAFDKKIPYIIEPRITDDGNIDLIFIKSFDAASQKSVKTESEIIDEFIDPLAGVVIYYSDEPFALNTEEIKIEDGFEQKVTANNKTVTVKRQFVLAGDFNTDKGDHILTIPFVDPFARKEIKSQHIIIAGFDELLSAKHFVNDEVISEQVKVDSKSMDVPTILGEKELSFSQTVPEINDFVDENGDSTNDFDKAVKSTSSIQMFKKAPVDEGFRAQSYRCYAYIDFPAGSVASRNVDNNIIGQNNLDLSFNSDNTKLTINFREQLDYIPVILPYAKSGNSNAKPGYSAINDSSPIDVRLTEINQTFATIVISKFTSHEPSMKLFVGFLAVT